MVPPAGETEKAADLIGQGKILASPMVMATVIASIQSGRLVVPSLVTSVTSPAPEGVSGPGPAEADALRSMLRGVVTGGSGSFLLDVPGPPVIAKTGTAEYAADGGGLRTHAWMIAAQGDLAVAVFVEDGLSRLAHRRSRSWRSSSARPELRRRSLRFGSLQRHRTDVDPRSTGGHVGAHRSRGVICWATSSGMGS